MVDVHAMPLTPLQRKFEDISGHGYTCFQSQDHQSGHKTATELLCRVGYNIRWMMDGCCLTTHQHNLGHSVS